ncbi:MAG TPA: aldolase [Allosphingosinicella sp.]|nr:aldolase [Allosphingosinicella sp.]
MTRRLLSSETVHASSVAIDGRGVLIGGRPGMGKSDLAFRLVDRGALLISDDYTIVRRVKGVALAAAPATIIGKIELRGVGIVELETAQDVPVALLVDLDERPERQPEPGETRLVAGVAIPVLRLAGLEASAPLKVEAALKLFGLAG